MRRTVQFWRITRSDGTALPGPYPGALAVRRLRRAAADGGRLYRTAPDGMEVLGQALPSRTHPMLALYRTRRANFPRLDDNGTISRLPLTPTQALAEPSFFVFLPRNTVGLLFNNDGPRAPRLADYLNAKLGSDVALRPVYRRDLAEVLDAMRMTAVEVSIPSAQVPRLGGGDDWAEILDNASRLVEDGAVSITMSIGRAGTRQDRDGRTAGIRRLVDQLRGRDPDQLAAFRTAKVRGTAPGSSSPITVDLLNQKFVAQVDVDDEALADADRAAAVAATVIAAQWDLNRVFVEASTPPADGDPDPSLVGGWVDTRDDERVDGPG